MHCWFKQPQETLRESGCELDERKSTLRVHLTLWGEAGILRARLSVLPVRLLALTRS